MEKRMNEIKKKQQEVQKLQLFNSTLIPKVYHLGTLKLAKIRRSARV
jgi:hypothetical protein